MIEHYDTQRGYLLRLPPGITSGNYLGFTLKKGFFYGRDQDGIPIAYTGSLTEPHFIYKLQAGKWTPCDISHEALTALIVG